MSSAIPTIPIEIVGVRYFEDMDELVVLIWENLALAVGRASPTD
jgi:hypothetical protein